MRTVVARLIHSRSSLSRFQATPASRNGRYLSTDSNKVDEPFKVEEAETIDVPPPPTEKLLVLGGNGFVGSHICKEALGRGLSVASLSRSGRPSLNESWANTITWHKGNLLSPDSWKEALTGVTSVDTCRRRNGSPTSHWRCNDASCRCRILPRPRCNVLLQRLPATASRCSACNDPLPRPVGDALRISCVGGFGSNSQMYKINGTANINAIRAAAEQGVRKFVYISAADFGLANYLLQGYYEGKRAAETELLTRFPYGGVILRPGFMHGTRAVGSLKLPLSVIGSPLEMILQRAKPLNQLPVVGPLFTPPVNVAAVAKVAVRAAADPVFPPGIVDVYGILRHSQQKSR